MERNLYIIFIAVIFFLICLCFILLSQREKRKTKELISKTRAKPVQNEEKQESKQEDIQQEPIEANLENFVIEKEEKTKDKSTEENEFDYKKFVDENIEALSKYHGYDELGDFEEMKKENFNDVLDPFLFGNQNLDED